MDDVLAGSHADHQPLLLPPGIAVDGIYGECGLEMRWPSKSVKWYILIHSRSLLGLGSAIVGGAQARNKIEKTAEKMRFGTRVFDPVGRVAVRLQDRCSAN